VAVVQYTFTHKQYTERHKTNNTKILEVQCGPCPVFAGFALAFALQRRKKSGKTSVRVAEVRVAEVRVAEVRVDEVREIEVRVAEVWVDEVR
jgi:hypothetical protein